jgi:xanthine dehydrogenase YagS FAD-binding subunit
VVDDGTVTSARIALGGVAHKPWRARLAEDTLIGEAASDETFARAADAELAQAEPLHGNEFKVELTRRTMVATLTTLVEGQPR